MFWGNRKEMFKRQMRVVKELTSQIGFRLSGYILIRKSIVIKWRTIAHNDPQKWDLSFFCRVRAYMSRANSCNKDIDVIIKCKF